MNYAVLVFALLFPVQLHKKELQVELLGAPRVKHMVLMTQPRYFGNDMQLVQEVRVVDEDGNPVADQTVTFSARTTDGIIVAVRADGVSDRSGRATVVGYLAIPSADLRLSLQACVRDSDYCSPPVTTDLRQRSGIEVDFSYANTVSAGEQPYRLNGVSETGDVIESEHVFGVEPRIQYSVLERGRGLKRLALSGYAAGAFHAVSTPYSFTQSKTDFRFGGMTTGFSAEVSRFHFHGAFTSPTGELIGNNRFNLSAYQPLSERYVLLGEFFYSEPRPNGSARGTFGASHGPLGGIAYTTRSGTQRLTAEAGWVWTGATRYDVSGRTATVEIPKRSTALIRVSDHIDRGGPVHLSVYGTVSGFGTGVMNFNIGANVRLRHFINGF